MITAEFIIAFVRIANGDGTPAVYSDNAKFIV